MSSRHPEPTSLQPPNIGAADSVQSRMHAGTATDAIPTGRPATHTSQPCCLRNSRNTTMNSSSSPNPDSLPASYTTRLLSSPQRYTDAHSTTTTTAATAPPIVNLPTADSIPQRVDSGYEDHLSTKPSSTATRDPPQVATEPRSTYASTLSPNSPAHGLYPAPDSEGLLDSRRPAPLSLGRKTSAPNLKPISRTPSVKSAAFNRGLGSAASSRVPSPIITAMGDVTPLPSPLLSGDSPGPWKRLQGRPPSRDAVPQLPTIMSESVLVTSNGESISSVVANQSKRRSLITSNGTPTDNNGNTNTTNNSDKIDTEGAKTKIHTRNRSISEYRPDHPNFPKRMSTVSGPRPGHKHQASLRREPHLSESRGLTPIEKPPSPPPSESSVTAGDSTSSLVKLKPNYEYFDARGRKDGKLRRWRAVKSLGQGTFSRVVLATSHVSASEDEIEAEHSAVDSGLLTSNSTSSLDRKALVAVKVCEHGPKGGASEERVEMSLKRELEIMQSIHHPSLVDLKAWSIEPTRAILVLSYCPGGDLFDVATAHSDLLTPSLIRRIFAELVGAVQYLHECHIVHRDIKLENVLVNLTPQELTDRSIDWQTYPYSVTTLTDLGLSRRVTDDEKLTTRCGSEDYAAPELIMGMEYSGFATDAWSVGVLLYALLENRLPFDPPPGISDALRMRSRTSHRIARVEWQWIKYAGEDGDHEGDAKKFESAGLLGAMEVTEALLRRASRRWPLQKVAEVEWVKGGIAVEGGLRFLEADEGEEVL